MYVDLGGVEGGGRYFRGLMIQLLNQTVFFIFANMFRRRGFLTEKTVQNPDHIWKDSFFPLFQMPSLLFFINKYFYYLGYVWVSVIRKSWTSGRLEG